MKTIVFGILFFTCSFIHAQSIYFDYTDGTNASYNIEEVRKITFDADVMNLHMLDESLYAWNVSYIGHYEYDESTSNLDGILDEINTMYVQIFPNPAKNNLNVRYTLLKQGSVIVELYDMEGKLTLQKELGLQFSGANQHQIDINEIKAGRYNCRIVFENNSVTKKVIIQ